jgi:hypothetical protein
MHVAYRAAELDHANADAKIHAVDERLFEEADEFEVVVPFHVTGHISISALLVVLWTFLVL